MKFVFLIVLGALISLNGMSQELTDLVGVWKVEAAVNEDGGECLNEIKSAFKLTFLEDGTYLKEEHSWNSPDPLKTRGSFSINDNYIRLTFLIGAFVTSHTYQIISFETDTLTVLENICPLRDEISSSTLILSRVK